jgi:Dolichyl-phosphate-mannose-protein mannosyltransferase
VKRFGVWLLVIGIMLPRIIRMGYPSVQIEDPNYIYGAYLMTLGQQPFLDFAQPNPPFLEGILAGLYLLFGVSHRVPEAVTALAYILTAILIARIGTRWFSRSAGRWAAGLYSIHFLLFRYHLFEREVFATLAAAAALDLLMRKSRPVTLAVMAGVVFGVGFACKQTALIPFLAVCAILFVFHRKIRSALGFFAGFTGCVLVQTGLYSLMYGGQFLRQTFWFHFIKGSVAPWQIKAGWTLAGLGYLVPLLCGAVFLFRKKLNSPEWIPAAMISADIVFFWFVSGAFWPHYLLSTLLPLALLSGWAVDTWIGSDHVYSVVRKRLSLAGAALVFAVMLLVQPASLIGKGAADNYGFSGTPREDVAECAATIRQHTASSDLVISDPFIALESHREKVVKFKDNWGLILWMNEMIESGKYREGLKNLGQSSFADVRKTSQNYWMPMVEKALRENKVGAIQPNYELPVQPDNLTRLGFKKGISKGQYDIWIRNQAGSSP